MCLLSRSIAVIVMLFFMLAGSVWTPTFAQTASPVASSGPHDAEVAATLAKATAVRDAFVARIHADGFSCPIPVPAILVEDVPSFGQYNEKTNVVRISDWTLLNPQERAVFFQLAGPGASEEAAHAEFEIDAHQWVFVHELGHWWQACRGVADDGRHYAKEFGANKISAAYWRELDPTVIPHMRAAFDQLLSHAPNPVPDGQDVEAYFDANYEKLGPTPAYLWFASRMAIKMLDETPAPGFAQVLKETKS
jgi:hypothetical protein